MVSGKSESFSRKKDQWPTQNQNEKPGKRKRLSSSPFRPRIFNVCVYGKLSSTGKSHHRVTPGLILFGSRNEQAIGKR
jgi:hypothetical protein